MQYLMIFDDQTVKQFESYHMDDEQSVKDGFLDIIRFDGGAFQRLIVNEDNTTAWSAV